jgi:hypothetical protein
MMAAAVDLENQIVLMAFALAEGENNDSIGACGILLPISGGVNARRRWLIS